MKTKITITDITHDDLVDLLGTATYGSSWIEIWAPDREGLDIADLDCREDVWAKALLAGKRILAVDHYAEGIKYSDTAYVDPDDDEESVIYPLTLNNIREGLEAAYSGEFAGDEETKEWLYDCMTDFRSGGMDNPEAEALMQVIMFGEIIY